MADCRGDAFERFDRAFVGMLPSGRRPTSIQPIACGAPLGRAISGTRNGNKGSFESILVTRPSGGGCSASHERVAAADNP